MEGAALVLPRMKKRTQEWWDFAPCSATFLLRCVEIFFLLQISRLFYFVAPRATHAWRVLRASTRLSGRFLNYRSFPRRLGTRLPRPPTFALLIILPSSPPPTQPSRKGSDFSDADSIDAAASSSADSHEDDREFSLTRDSRLVSVSACALQPLPALQNNAPCCRCTLIAGSAPDCSCQVSFLLSTWTHSSKSRWNNPLCPLAQALASTCDKPSNSRDSRQCFR